jgi:hypothetical protein
MKQKHQLLNNGYSVHCRAILTTKRKKDKKERKKKEEKEIRAVFVTMQKYM